MFQYPSSYQLSVASQLMVGCQKIPSILQSGICNWFISCRQQEVLWSMCNSCPCPVLKAALHRPPLILLLLQVFLPALL